MELQANGHYLISSTDFVSDMSGRVTLIQIKKAIHSLIAQGNPPKITQLQIDKEIRDMQPTAEDK